MLHGEIVTRLLLVALSLFCEKFIIHESSVCVQRMSREKEVLVKIGVT